MSKTIRNAARKGQTAKGCILRRIEDREWATSTRYGWEA